MNVHGMPWYLEDRTGQGDGAIAGTGAPGHGDGALAETCQGDGSLVRNSTEPVKLTRRESLALAFGMFKAMLLVILIGVGGLALFILFCIHIWFR